MILENFKKTIMKHKKISAWTSSGVDSSFGLFFILHTIQEKKLDAEVTPIFGNDLNDPHSLKAINYILKYYKDTFYNVKLNNKYCMDYKITDEIPWKVDHFRPHMPYINKTFDINFNFNTSPPAKKDEEFKKIHPEPLEPIVEKRYIFEKEERRPFLSIDKKWIAEQYIKYDLMDKIYPYTISCVDLDKTGEICHKCFWCKERIWAFGKQR